MASDFPVIQKPTIEHFVTSGKFCLDGGQWDVDNNVYFIADADSDSVIVIDPAHEPDTIKAKIGQRAVRAIVLTHAHNDHCELAPQLAREFGVDVYLHPDDDMLWKESNGDAPYIPIDVNDSLWQQWAMRVHHTPGHTPGCVVIEVLGAAEQEATGKDAPGAGAAGMGTAEPGAAVAGTAEPGAAVAGTAEPGAVSGNVLLSGDTLFSGGPGATGRKYSSFPVIIESLKNIVFQLDHSMEVRPGHGDFTTVGAEAARIEEYEQRGY